MQKYTPLFWMALLLIIFISACGTPATPPPTLTPVPPRATPLPTSTPLPTFTPIPTAAPPERTQYKLYLKLDYLNHTVTVGEEIRYPNQTGETLDDLLLAFVPNIWTGTTSLSGLTVNEQNAEYTINGQRLDVKLSAPLVPGAVASVKIAYTLNLPEITEPDPTVQRPRMYGYTARQLNLVNWYPFIVPYVKGQGWLLHDPWYFGEHLVYDVADFDVLVSYTEGQAIPVLATSGEEVSAPIVGTQRYTLERGRAFAISASTDYLVSEQDAGGVTVRSYYFPLYEAAGQAALRSTVQAIQILREKFGPIPHNTLSVVQGDFADSMEFSALYFHSKKFYDLYDGTTRSYLTFVAAHETAHQWWFEKVANDQALEPWLDEALCTFSERVFYEATDPAAIGEFWQYARIDQYNPVGFVDTVVADAGGYQPYENAVYRRGELFLQELRERMGDAAFFTLLRDYADAMAGRRATTADFFAAVRQHTDYDFSDIIAKYFQRQP